MYSGAQQRITVSARSGTRVLLWLSLTFFCITYSRVGLADSTRSTAPGSDRLGDHYLMLVNTAQASRLDAAKLVQFDRSPYDALAVSFEDAYDTSAVLPLEPMQLQLADWSRATSKTIWPWVYLNRIIGANNDEANALAKAPYFERFQGLDFDDKAGAQSDFLQIWVNALQLARTSGAPGVVVDPEFYNNYKAANIAELALMTSKTRDETLGELRRLGAKMADVAGREYPGATLWFLFTGFTNPDYRVIEETPYYLASTYIVEGLLDEIQQRHLALRVLSGGEVGLGYCHRSLDDFREAIEKRAAIFAPLLRRYEGILELAGTMTLWSDRSAKKNWVAQGACGGSDADSVEDLIPYMELLFRSYRSNWIYGSPNGGYLAFDAASAPRFDAAITESKARAYAVAEERLRDLH